MLRRITAEQSAGEQPEHADETPDQAVPPPVPGNQPAPQPPQYQQPGYQQQYPQQSYPPQQQQYPPQQQYPQQPYPQQYPPQQAYPPPPYQQQQYPQQQYPPPYHQQPPGQAAPQYQQAPPHPQADQSGWGAPQPEEPDSDGVFRRFRRIASEAAYLVGASGQMQRDVDNIATVRRPIAIMRRIGVLSPVTGAGTSTVTALLATVLSAQRADRVVAVDADPMEAELSRRLEQTLGSGPLEGVSLVRSETTAEAVRSTLAEVQGQGARDVGLAVVDCPDTMFGEISTELASNGHAAVLVVPSIQHIATYALSQLDQLTPDGQDVLLNPGGHRHHGRSERRPGIGPLAGRGVPPARSGTGRDPVRPARRPSMAAAFGGTAGGDPSSGARPGRPGGRRCHPRRRRITPFRTGS